MSKILCWKFIRFEGDSRYTTRLSIDELHAFADQIRGLPCVIKEEKLVDEMFKKVLQSGSSYSLLCNWQSCNDPRLCWQNFWYLSKSVQFLMLNKTRVVPSLKKFLGYPGRGCFCQNFHKKSQNFFLLESALCWTLYREKIWSSASFHQISSKSMQQY